MAVFIFVQRKSKICLSNVNMFDMVFF